MKAILSKKVCTKCKEGKNSKEFYPHKDGALGLRSTCKTCDNKSSDDRRRTPEGLEVNRKRSEKYRRENPEAFKLSVKMSSYKKLGLTITKEEYKALYEKQSGLCAICKNPPLGFKKTLCLDHDHESMKIRGLLCDNCNGALGKFQDNPEILFKAFIYLKSSKDKMFKSYGNYGGDLKVGNQV